MISPDSGQRLQNSVPSIMHVSSDEKPMVTGPILNSAMASAEVRKTKAMVMFRRLVLELNSFSSCVSTQPPSAPSASEHTISISGSTTMEITSNEPVLSAFAMPNDTANTIRPTASSSATMGSSRSTSGPFALYCRTTMSVAAGAVAVAMAPSVMACAMDSLPFVSSAITISAISTRNVAASACKTPMTNACLPVCFSSDTRNSLPMENAMKPSATSEISDRLSTDSCVGKPRPSMPSRPRQYGPIRTPATRYAVTDGSFSGFATRVISRPARTATDNDNSVRISNSFISTFLHTSLYTLPSKMQEELVKNE